MVASNQVPASGVPSSVDNCMDPRRVEGPFGLPHTSSVPPTSSYTLSPADRCLLSRTCLAFQSRSDLRRQIAQRPRARPHGHISASFEFSRPRFLPV